MQKTEPTQPKQPATRGQKIAAIASIAVFFIVLALLAVFVGGHPGAAWFDRGTARVAFDFTVESARVSRIVFRAEPTVLATLHRRRGPHRR